MRRGTASRIVSTVSLVARPLSTSGLLRPRLHLGPRLQTGRAMAAFASFAIAEHVGRVGVLIAAYQRGGGLQAAAVATALLVPAAILAPLVSRELSAGQEVNPIAAGYALQCVALSMAATILALDLQPMLFYTAGVLAAVANVFSRPAHDAFLRGRRSREGELGAAAATQRVSGGALVLGPLLSSAVLAQLGVVQVVAVGAALHAIATVLTLGLRTVSPSLDDTPGTADEPMLEPRRCPTLLFGLVAAVIVVVSTAGSFAGSTDPVVAFALVSVGMQIVLVAAARPECWLIGPARPK